MFADVPLAKRVNHWIEWSGSGIMLDILSAALSLLTVFTYMVGYTAACTVHFHVMGLQCSCAPYRQWYRVSI
jgi:hypothetical protein